MTNLYSKADVALYHISLVSVLNRNEIRELLRRYF